jgi:hypothetical protein
VDAAAARGAISAHTMSTNNGMSHENLDRT